MRNFHVYILASRSRTLYIGMTGNLVNRLARHCLEPSGFVARYSCNRLVYFEWSPTARAAIDRETQLKKWRREKKIALITAMNPGWDDLASQLGILDEGTA